MAVAAELRTSNTIFAFLDRSEPRRHAQARGCVLTGSHRTNGKAMDHVERTDMKNDGLVHRHDKIVLHHDVVFCIEVVLAVNAERIAARRKRGLLPTEL